MKFSHAIVLIYLLFLSVDEGLCLLCFIEIVYLAMRLVSDFHSLIQFLKHLAMQRRSGTIIQGE